MRESRAFGEGQKGQEAQGTRSSRQQTSVFVVACAEDCKEKSLSSGRPLFLLIQENQFFHTFLSPVFRLKK